MHSSAPIELLVNDSNYFRIREVERFADGSGYVGRLSLRSSALALYDLTFYFDNLPAFRRQVRNLYESLRGAAELRHTWEADYLSLKASARGHVVVSGHFHTEGDTLQQMDFAFETDQTYLPRLIRSLDVVLGELSGK